MKVVHFTNNTIDGAGKAVYRLHRALQAAGIDSKMLVLGKSIDDNSIVEIRAKAFFRCFLRTMCVYANKIFWRFASQKVKPNTLFNFNLSFITFWDIREYVKDVDVICLHSVQSFLSPEFIREIHEKTNAPFVWTLMDIEPLTGGCHFHGECVKFEKECGNCPKLKDPKKNDLSRKIFKRKEKYLKDLPITFVAGSSWVFDHIKKSSLFKNKQIRNIFLSVDETMYKNIDRQLARKMLGLPQDKKIIVFGCFNFNQKRKGAKHLLDALKKGPEKISGDKKDILKDVLLVTFGDNDGFDFSGIPFEWKHIGILKSGQELAYIYHSADILAIPSLDDCGPMMVNESFMCGIPVVAYKVGVAPDLIRSEQSGYIAERYDIEDFCSGIIHCLLFENRKVQNEEIKELRQMCGAEHQAGQYKMLFNDILELGGKKDG